MTAQELKELRSKHKLSQRDAAELLGLSRWQYQQIEGGHAEPNEEVTGRLDAWMAAPAPEPDELPEPPYSPGRDPEPDEPEEKERPRRRERKRSSGSQLTAWQEDTAVKLTALLQGQMVVLEVDGVEHQVVVPGLTQVVQKFDDTDAFHIYQGAPALSVALVKVAPRHPWLRAALEMSAAGGDYRELTVALAAIVVPIAIHHGLFSPPALPIIDQEPEPAQQQPRPAPPAGAVVEEQPEPPRQEPAQNGTPAFNVREPPPGAVISE